MRIPRYRPNVQMTTEAPGRPINARMDPRFEVAAIEAKSNVLNTAISAASEYAVQRQKMINEAKRNEAIFGAKEGLLALVDNLEASKDPFNIINLDNKSGRWFDEVEKIRLEMRSKVTQTEAELAYFDSQFKQNEISLRFQLKDKLDTIIQNRADAALGARNDQYIARYSNPYVDYTLFNEESAEMNNLLRAAVENGRMSQELKDEIGTKSLNQITKNLVTAYAGTDPNLVYNLSNYLDVLDAFEGETDPAKLKERDKQLGRIILPNGEWTKIVLSSVDRSVARNELATVMTKANKFENYRDKQQERLDQLTDRQFDNLKNLAFSQALTDGNEQDLETLKEQYGLIFTAQFIRDIEALDIDGDGKIRGDDFQTELLGFLNRNNRLSVSEQSQLEETIRLGNSIFAQFDDELLVDQLSQSLVNNLDSRSILQQNKSRLTRETYLQFEQNFENITKELRSDIKTNLNDIIQIVKNDLNFVDKDVVTGAERVSLQSTNTVIGQLRRAVLAEGSELNTYSEILTKADELIAEERKKMKRALIPIFVNLKQDIDENANFRGVITIDSTDPLKDLEDKYNSFPANQKKLIEPDYLHFVGRLDKLVSRGFFK